MSEFALLWVGMGLSVIVLASLAAALFTARRRRGGRTVGPLRPLISLPPCGGPIVRLDFAQSLDPMRFAQAAEEEALAYARTNLHDHLADSTTITLQALRLWAGRHDLTVTASAAGSAAWSTGKAALQQHESGRLLPHLVDAESGKLVEVLKGAGYGRKAIAGLAAASTIVVSVAHIIATADLARTLRLVDQKLDLLLALRQIDQQAALERIYTAARELLAGPLDEVRRLELWRLRGELRELRSSWRREFEHHLVLVDDPAQKGWVERTFTRQSSQDRRITGQISEGQVQLAMLEYSLRVDRVLAAASGSWEVSQLTLADELAAIERVGALLQDRAGFISEAGRDEVQPMIDGIGAIVAGYRELLPQRRDASSPGAIAGSAAAALIEGQPYTASGPELHAPVAGPKT
jgi:hypothetical protein